MTEYDDASDITEDDLLLILSGEKTVEQIRLQKFTDHWTIEGPILKDKLIKDFRYVNTRELWTALNRNQPVFAYYQSLKHKYLFNKRDVIKKNNPPNFFFSNFWPPKDINIKEIEKVILADAYYHVLEHRPDFKEMMNELNKNAKERKFEGRRLAAAEHHGSRKRRKEWKKSES